MCLTRFVAIQHICHKNGCVTQAWVRRSRLTGVATQIARCDSKTNTSYALFKFAHAVGGDARIRTATAFGKALADISCLVFEGGTPIVGAKFEHCTGETVIVPSPPLAPRQRERVRSHHKASGAASYPMTPSTCARPEHHNGP